MKMKYQVVTGKSNKVVAYNFKTLMQASEWADINDYGLFENEGGLIVLPYWEN